MLCINTDFEQDCGDPEPALRQIAQAGFTHVHWCHHWNDDFAYSRHEIKHIAELLAKYRLGLCGIHAPAGGEKQWASPFEHQRFAGVELVANRMKMAADLWTDFIVLHVLPLPNEATELDAYWETLARSLSALHEVSRKTGVRIALENGLLEYNSHFDVIGRLLDEWEPEFLGMCYDSGHGHIDSDGLDHLERLKGRLIATHLHDNDGKSDQHMLPYSATIDWTRLVSTLAGSYHGPIMLELIKPKERPAREFLADAVAAARRLTAAVEAAR